MHDQNAQTAQHALGVREIGHTPPRPRFAAQHFEQAFERASAAADAAPLGVGDHQCVAHLVQLPGLAAHVDLRFVSRGLVIVGRGQDEIVPGLGSVSHD